MSKKKRRQETPEPGTPGPDGFRRVLLGVVTALIVARPFVLGEDPGLLSPLSDTAPMALSLFWMLALVAWAVWRFSNKREEWHGGLVEGLLLLAGVAVAVSSFVAPYKHPARLVTWEWFLFFFALVLLRQVFTTESDQRHLTAALLATVVTLSAYAIYQYNVELPTVREYLDRPSAQTAQTARWAAGVVGMGRAGPLDTAMLLDPRGGEESAANLDADAILAEQREKTKHANATYSQPASFAALLLLFLPALVAAAVVLRRQGRALQAGLAAGCVALAAAALWLTHVLATLFGAAGRGGLWATAWAMIRDNLWLGIGAGNYGRVCPRYLVSGAEPANDPQSFVLELWATYGLLALLAVLAALGTFFWIVFSPASRERQRPEGEKIPEGEKTPEGDTPVSPEGTRWEFYFGGMGGLLTAFTIRQAGVSPDALLAGLSFTPDNHLIDAFIAVGRGIVWFAAFALFESVRWPGRLLPVVLAAGVGAALVLLAFTGGISFPSVALPLWLTVGLALAALNRPAWKPATPQLIVRLAPLLLALGFFLAYFLYLFDPVVRGTNLAGTAARAGRLYDVESATGFVKIRDPIKHINEQVLVPFEQAAREDFGNARWRVHVAKWNQRQWYLMLRTRDLQGLQTVSFKAVQAANVAQELDPDGPEGYLTQHSLHLLFAETKRGVERTTQLDLAAEALRRLTRADPRNPQLHYRLAKLLLTMNQVSQGVESAENALGYDDETPRPPRKLTPWQRRMAEAWTSAPASTPAPALMSAPAPASAPASGPISMPASVPRVRRLTRGFNLVAEAAPKRS